MFIAIVQHTPAWVWALLVALTALGLSQTRPREMSLARVTVLPLAMLLLSLSGAFHAFGHVPMAAGGWAAGFGAALVLARHAVTVRGASWCARTQRLSVPGSWLPMTMILGVFGVKYIVGAALGVHPSLSVDPTFTVICSAAYGGCSALFIARAHSLRALAMGAGALRTA